jgi:hypothetical protein
MIFIEKNGKKTKNFGGLLTAADCSAISHAKQLKRTNKTKRVRIKCDSKIDLKNNSL